jgi:hypothetical protein
VAKGNWKPDPRHEPKEPDHHCNGKVRGRVSADDGAAAYCSKVAGWGTNHVGVGRCKWHGGASETYDNKANELLAKAALEQYGIPVEVDPQTALLEELFRTQGHVVWLRERVAELETERMHGAVGGAAGGIPERKPHIWITMYKEERLHLSRVAKSCIDAGIEERRVRIAEEQGALLAKVVQGILTSLGIPLDAPETKKAIRDNFAMLEPA